MCNAKVIRVSFKCLMICVLKLLIFLNGRGGRYHLWNAHLSICVQKKNNGGNFKQLSVQSYLENNEMLYQTLDKDPLKN